MIKTMINQTNIESPKPVAEAESLVGIASADLLAFSSILGGLLASGRYTEKLRTDEYDNYGNGLICDDLGRDWVSDTDGDPHITRRHMPVVLQTAEMLWDDMKQIIQANTVIK